MSPDQWFHIPVLWSNLLLGNPLAPARWLLTPLWKNTKWNSISQTFSIFTAFLLLFTVPHSFPVSAVYIACLPIQRRRFNNIVLHSIDQKNLVLCLIYLVSLKHIKIQHSCLNLRHGPRGTGEGVKCVGKRAMTTFLLGVSKWVVPFV